MQTETTPKIIILPDGFNGHLARFFAEPIEIDGNLVKLRCAEPGQSHFTAWKHVSVLAGQNALVLA